MEWTSHNIVGTVIISIFVVAGIFYCLFDFSGQLKKDKKRKEK